MKHILKNIVRFLTTDMNNISEQNYVTYGFATFDVTTYIIIY